MKPCGVCLGLCALEEIISLTLWGCLAVRKPSLALCIGHMVRKTEIEEERERDGYVQPAPAVPAIPSVSEQANLDIQTRPASHRTPRPTLPDLTTEETLPKNCPAELHELQC